MKGRVLVVDDDTEMCRMLEDTLKRRGFCVEWRLSAVDALSLVSSSDFDAVLTDVNMPGLSGIHLVEQLKTNRPDLPTIVMTAFGSMETAVSAMRAGAYDFVTKPIDTDILALALERVPPTQGRSAI
jgi:two-component system response regulator HydG